MPKFHVARSIEIDASRDQVFDTVADYGTWTRWSPWLCMEPTADVQVTDDAASVGSGYSWNGELVGQGAIEHRQLESGRLIEDEIRFVKPFRSQSEVVFEVEPAGSSTKLTWHMRGSLPWYLFWLRSQMEVFIAADYDRGLKMLKEYIETGNVCSQTTVRGVQPVGPLQMFGLRKQCDERDISRVMETAFEQVKQTLNSRGLPTDGDVISVYHKFDMKARTFDFTSGFVVPESVTSVPSELSKWSLPETQALVVEHRGRYDHLGNGWTTAHQYARHKKLKLAKSESYEIYRNDPEQTPPDQWLTEIFLPLR